MNGDASHKSNWWQFLPYLRTSSNQTFLAYMVSNFSGQNLDAEIQEKDGLQSTRNASLIEFHETMDIENLGRMEITMWALGFICLEESCDKLTPVVLQAIPDSRYGFFSLWEEEQGGNLTNSVTSKVLSLKNWNLPRENVSGMALRTLDSSEHVPLCKGLQFGSVGDILEGDLDVQNFNIKTAPEAAGFRLQEPVASITRPEKNLCLLGIDSSDSSSGLQLLMTTTVVEILGSFMVQVRNSYIQAQNSALDLQHPGTDFWLVFLALPSAFIAVVAAAIPFINFQLKFFRDLTSSQSWKTVVLCISNSVLALASYSAVIAVTPAEARRQNRFPTWGLLADQVPITSRGLQVLVVVRGESVYRSDILIAVWVSTLLLILVVTYMTFARCRQVFFRRRLLKSWSEVKLESDVKLDDLRAIEMSSVEQRQLEKSLQTMQVSDVTIQISRARSAAYQRVTTSL